MSTGQWWAIVAGFLLGFTAYVLLIVRVVEVTQ